MRNQRAFTIMELMITIVVLAILTTLAVPAFRTFIQNNRLAAQANEMVATFQLARSEALKRGLTVRVCSSSDGTSCGGDWKEGWIVLADPGGTDQELLRVWPSPGADFVFTPASGSGWFQSSGCFDHDDSGQCSAPAGNDLLQLDLDRCSTNNIRQLLVTPAGSVATERKECS
ncbi:MAG: GspH/FimT family pseudopilin [Wenzhouxiangellaceae bacterium]|nr:GspH/FimT family pseudopilin [Wenzhouxiangellaceae bacterium]